MSALRQAQSTATSGSTPPMMTLRRMPHVWRPGLASITACARGRTPGREARHAVPAQATVSQDCSALQPA